MVQRLLLLKSDGKPFPSDAEPLMANSFKYAARPMGGVPIITASLRHSKCLDNEWTGKEYVKFKGERFYLKQVPTSTKTNDDARYSYDIELVSLRFLLDNVYFYDATVGEDNDADKIATNNTKFVFGGTLGDYIAKLNASLKYSGLDDKFLVKFDDGYESSQDFATVSIDDLFFSSALQMIFSVFKVTYRFDGRDIIVGNFSTIKTVDENGDKIDFVFKYGYNESLLSIRKITKDQKTVNRASARGSSENLDYYYPNVTSKGDIGIEINEGSTEITEANLTVSNQRLLANKLNVGDVVKFVYSQASDSFKYSLYNYDSYSSNTYTDYDSGIAIEFESNVLSGSVYRYCHKKRIAITTTAAQQVTFKLIDTFANVRGTNSVVPNAAEVLRYDYNIRMYRTSDNTLVGEYAFSGIPESPEDGYEIILGEVAAGDYYIVVDCIYNIQCEWNLADSYPRVIFGQYSWEVKPSIIGGNGRWVIQDSGKNIYDLTDYGLELTNIDEGCIPNMDGDSFKVILKEGSNLMPYQENLVPTVYRKSWGKEMFYNAINYPFKLVEGYDLNKPAGEEARTGEDGLEYVHNDNYKDEDGKYIKFENPYSIDNPKEQIFKAEHIKVTIEGITNDKNTPIDKIYAVAYDINDNNKTVEKNEGESTSVEYEHPYFFIKFPKLPFNLFDHALESGDMTVSMKTGKCASCNFTIGVDDNGRNPVQVDGDGGLKRDENGDVIYTGNPQDEQQDTKNNEVWVALQKEESTFGFIMPNKERDFLVESGDNFVITNISLPNEYVYSAEQRLTKEIIKYLRDNNASTHDFEIKFSRIFLQNNPAIRDSLSENSILIVEYNNKQYTLYVTSYSYNANNEALPEITVSLSDKLEISQNSLQQAIEEVKEEVSTVYCIKKDVEDTTRARVKFAKGISFEQGYNVSGSGTAALDMLTANKIAAKSASFDSLNISSLSVGNFSVQDFVASTAIISSFNNAPTFERGLRIGEILLSYDNDNKALKVTSWDGSFNAAVTASGDLVAFGSLQSELPSGGVTRFGELSDVPTVESGTTKYWGWDGSAYAWLNAPEGGGTTNLDNYYTKAEVNNLITGYATQAWVTAQGYLKSVSWSNIQDKPTTLADYGIDDDINALLKGYVKTLDFNSFKGNYENLAASVKSANDYTDGKISKLNIDQYAKADTLTQAITDFNTAIGGINDSLKNYALLAGNNTLTGTNTFLGYLNLKRGAGASGTLFLQDDSEHTNYATQNGVYFTVSDGGFAIHAHKDGAWKNQIAWIAMDSLKTTLQQGISVNNITVRGGDALFNGKATFNANTYINAHTYINANSYITGRLYLSNGNSGVYFVCEDDATYLYKHNNWGYDPYVTFFKLSALEKSGARSGLVEIGEQSHPGTLKIGNAYLTYDSDNNALFVKGKDGAPINLVATGDVAAFSGLGSGFDTLTDLTLTNKLTVKDIQASNKITAKNIDAQYLSVSNSMQQSMDMGGYDIDNCQTCTCQYMFTNEINLGSDQITELSVSGSYIYLRINGTRYKISATNV